MLHRTFSVTGAVAGHHLSANIGLAVVGDVLAAHLETTPAIIRAFFESTVVRADTRGAIALVFFHLGLHLCARIEQEGRSDE